jgi:hypothetical protein
MTLPIAKRPHREPLPPEAESWLRTGYGGWWFWLGLGGSEERAREFWGLHRGAVIAEHARAHPGHRPHLWWQYDAPEMRRRLGGIGTPMSECSACAPSFRFGVPHSWLTSEINSSCGTPVCEVDPPLYESEPS